MTCASLPLSLCASSPCDAPPSHGSIAPDASHTLFLRSHGKNDTVPHHCKIPSLINQELKNRTWETRTNDLNLERVKNKTNLRCLQLSVYQQFYIFKLKNRVHLYSEWVGWYHLSPVICHSGGTMVSLMDPFPRPVSLSLFFPLFVSPRVVVPLFRVVHQPRPGVNRSLHGWRKPTWKRNNPQWTCYLIELNKAWKVFKHLWSVRRSKLKFFRWIDWGDSLTLTCRKRVWRNRTSIISSWVPTAKYNTQAINEVLKCQLRVETM